jgi:hypothetical protein
MVDHVARTPQELKESYDRCLRLLGKSSDAFDLGESEEILTVAANLRVLLHNKPPNCRSLLDQLGLSKRQFVDTSEPASDLRLARGPDGGFVAGLFHGLAVVSCNEGFLAKLDFPGGMQAQLPFADWWEGIVVAFQAGPDSIVSFSRKQVVLLLADKDACHVDSHLPLDYAHLKRNAVCSTAAFSGGPPGTPPTIPVREMHGQRNLHEATVRQIAHEVMKTLVPGYGRERHWNYPVFGSLALGFTPRPTNEARDG